MLGWDNGRFALFLPRELWCNDRSWHEIDEKKGNVFLHRCCSFSPRTMFACVSRVCETPYGRRPVYTNLLPVNMSVYVVRPRYFPSFCVCFFSLCCSPRPVGDQLRGALAAWGSLHEFGCSSNTTNAGFLEINTPEVCVQRAVTDQDVEKKKKRTLFFFSSCTGLLKYFLLYRFSTDLLCTKHGNGDQKKISGRLCFPFLRQTNVLILWMQDPDGLFL